MSSLEGGKERRGGEEREGGCKVKRSAFPFMAIL